MVHKSKVILELTPTQLLDDDNLISRIGVGADTDRENNYLDRYTRDWLA